MPSFLDLPPEIRLYVYDILLTNKTKAIYVNNVKLLPCGVRHGSRKLGTEDKYYLQPAILRTCKTVYKEGWSKLYSGNHFSFTEDALSNFWFKHRRQHLDTMRNITITIDYLGEKDIARLMGQLCQRENPLLRPTLNLSDILRWQYVDFTPSINSRPSELQKYAHSYPINEAIDTAMLLWLGAVEQMVLVLPEPLAHVGTKVVLANWLRFFNLKPCKKPQGGDPSYFNLVWGDRCLLEPRKDMKEKLMEAFENPEHIRLSEVAGVWKTALDTGDQ